MSKGNIIKISSGSMQENSLKDYTAYAKNIHTNAGSKVVENSKDGIIYGEPEVKKIKEDMIDITVGVFFDGTLNNKNNNKLRVAHNLDKSNHRKDWAYDKEDSFENAPSNVQNLEQTYPQEPLYFSVYIEGVGTKAEKINADNKNLDRKDTNRKDDLIGYGLAFGEEGLIKKVKRGCLLVANKISSTSRTQGKKINQITIDVFGFSRGATCARHFLYEITKPADKADLYPASDGKRDYYVAPADKQPRYIPKQDYVVAKGEKVQAHIPVGGALGQYLKDNGVTYNSIVYRFAGLFDSVSSHGIIHSNDIDDLHLHAINKMSKIFHLTAADEIRSNFPLTPVTKGITKSIPGVHSDIGGGYRDSINDQYVLEKNKEESVVLSYELGIDKTRTRLIQQGWYLESQLKIEPIGRTFRLVGTRTLGNAYAMVPLHIMADFCVAYGHVKINTTSLNALFKIQSTDPALDLQDLYQRLKSYAFDKLPPMQYFTDAEINALRQKVAAHQVDEETYKLHAKDQKMLKQLRNRYLHYSADSSSFAHKPTSSGKREIFN